MHLSYSLSLALPALAAAQAQKPLFQSVVNKVEGWLGVTESYADSAAPAVSAATKDPVGSSAAKVAAIKVTPLTTSNWESVLTPEPSGPSPQEWMVFVSGGNKTCGGHCAHVEKVWNETASLLAADLTSPRLGSVNCDVEGVLCATWMAKPPTIWYIQRAVAKADQSTPASTIYINYLNVTSHSVGDMMALHTGKKYENGVLYEGFFHPFDGLLAQYGALKPVGYVMFGFGLIPSWAFMILVSMVSRTIM